MLATLFSPKNITRNWSYDSSVSASKESFQKLIFLMLFLVCTKTIQGISKLPLAFYQALCWFVFEWFVWASWKIVNLNWLIITWNFDGGSLYPLECKFLTIPLLKFHEKICIVFNIVVKDCFFFTNVIQNVIAKI